RLEGIAEPAQAFALGLVVLDDAVVDEREFAVADVRVRVVLGHAAVGRPAGVADPERGAEAFGGRRGLHLGDAPGAAHAAYARVRDHGDAGGVVAAVLEPFEALDEHRDHVTASDRADDSTHGKPPFFADWKWSGSGSAGLSAPVSADTRPSRVRRASATFPAWHASCFLERQDATARGHTNDGHPRHLGPGPARRRFLGRRAPAPAMAGLRRRRRAGAAAGRLAAVR